MLCICHQSTKFVFNTQHLWLFLFLQKSHQSTKFVFNTQQITLVAFFFLPVTNLQNSYSIHKRISKLILSHQSTKFVFNTQLQNDQKSFGNKKSPIYKIRLQYTTEYRYNLIVFSEILCHQSTKFVFNWTLFPKSPIYKIRIQYR